MSQSTTYTDVLVCGAGPVGLLTAYCLSRFGVSTMVIEQHTPVKKIQYGRGIVIMPRTLELLDQLDLADALGQIAFIGRGQQFYRDGKLVEGISPKLTAMTDTFFDHIYICRQRWTEQVITDAYKLLSGTSLQHGTKLLSTEIRTGSDGYNVLSTTENQAGQKTQIKSKYIIGADGSRSRVRDLAGIPFEGEGSNRRWARIDGLVETDMPNARFGGTTIHSASHGTVLWMSLDHNATRVGFALPEALWAAADNISQEDVIREAQEAVKPFSLKFKTVDWWTVYSIGQRLAKSYKAQEYMLVAGDAAHTHSSASAQGMNTGLHDAVNLSWKLAGKIKGQLTDSVLDSYELERKAIAGQIIAQDKISSVLTEGKIPLELQNDPEKDSHRLLFKVLLQNQHLNTGLGITYPEDGLTIAGSTDSVALKVPVGGRALDILIQRPGMQVSLRLFSQIKNDGRFTVLVFCGDSSKTERLLMLWRDYLDSAQAFLKYRASIIRIVSILIHDNQAGAAEENMKIPRYGEVFYDPDRSAHECYGVLIDKGAVLVLRPDGHLGTACGLDEGSVLSAYFAKFIAFQKEGDNQNCRDEASTSHVTKGEIQFD